MFLFLFLREFFISYNENYLLIIERRFKMVKEAMSIDVSSSTESNKRGRISLYFDDENNERACYEIKIEQARWLRHALKHAINLRKEK